MKALWGIIGFVIGIAVTAGVCSFSASVQQSRRKSELLSSVNYPIRVCLEDIVQTYDRDDARLAQRKVRLLQQRWTAYVNEKGRAPEQFMSEVVDLGQPSIRSGK